MPQPSTIGGINRLPPAEKRSFYARIIPPELLAKFSVPPSLIDPQGRDLLEINGPAGTSDVKISLRHAYDAPDPIIFGHLTDTIQEQIHILIYGMNDPTSPRYNVDRLPNGEKTNFGRDLRNIPEERKALAAGLAPGQTHRGPHLFKESLVQFEKFVSSLGHELFFVEPLYYHVAVIFEWHGFSYQSGRSLMKDIQAGFSPEGALTSQLDGSTPFRQPEAANSIRLRSWAVHDNILGHPFPDITMYKLKGKHSRTATTGDIPW